MRRLALGRAPDIRHVYQLARILQFQAHFCTTEPPRALRMAESDLLTLACCGCSGRHTSTKRPVYDPGA
eukprot:6183287-Pleurochrysis_carterae.AAC.1